MTKTGISSLLCPEGAALFERHPPHFSTAVYITFGGLAASASGTGYNLALQNTASAAIALTVGGNNASTTYAGVLSGSGSLIKTGTGTLTLAATNTYTGNTTISAGTLALGATGSINNSSDLSIAAGATCDVTAISAFNLSISAGLSASGTSTPAAIKGASGGTVSLGSSPITLSYDGSDPVLVILQGTLSLNGNPFTVNTATPLADGTYVLIQQASGSVIASGTNTVTGTAIGPGKTANISVSGGNVMLTVATIFPTLVWSAAPANYQWDITSSNWEGGPGIFANGDLVQFTDGGSASSPIALVGTLSPALVTVNISTNNYIFGGAGQISGATGINKQGPATLTLDNGAANTFTGLFTLGGGAVQIGSHDTAGSLGAGAVNVTGAGTMLAFNRTDSIEVDNQIAGGASNQPNLVVNSGHVTLGSLADNTYAYATVNSGGTLVLAKTSGASVHALGGGPTALTINSNGTAMLGGSGGNQIADAQNVQLNGGTFDLAGMNETMGQFNGYGTITNSGGAATLTLGGSANSSGALYPAGGTLSLAGGTVTVGGTWNNDFGIYGGSTFNLTGGTFNSGNYFAVGNHEGSGVAYLVANGGTLSSGAEFLVGFLRPAVVAINNGASLNLNYYSFGDGTVNNTTNWFNGGLIALQHFHDRGSSPATFYFNGTLLQAKSSDTAFFPAAGNVIANVTTNGAFFDTKNYALTISTPLLHDPAVGAMADGGLTKQAGSGTLTLSGANTYSGNTTINAGTLALGVGGSISKSATISIAGGATFDVSAQSSPYILASNTSLTTSGTGTTVGASAAAINGAAGGTVSLGSNLITLNYDGSDPALYVSQGTLSLNGNAFTVYTTNGASLPVGTYTLVQQASGNITSSGIYSVSGPAIGSGETGAILVIGGSVILTIGIDLANTTITVETAADGSGTVVAGQSFSAGSTFTMYAIARATSDGTFLANVPATWSFSALTGGVVGGDLVVAGDSKSATFTGNLVGTASVSAAWSGLSSPTPMASSVSTAQMTGPGSFTLAGSGSPNQTYQILASTNLTVPVSGWKLVGSANATSGGLVNFVDLQATNTQMFYRLVGPPATESGLLTVVPGAATQVSVETAADGSGSVVPAQTCISGFAFAVYAVTRDANGNFVANAAANSWTMVNNTGGVQNSNLSPSSGPNSMFTANASGTGKISAKISGLTPVVSGLINVITGSSLSWSATPANYQWDTTSADWMGGTGIFGTGTTVLFTDIGSALSPITLVGALSPASVTVNASTNNYTFGGSGYLTGAGSLVKNGSSTLTLANTTPNTYTGGTFVNGGILKITTADSVNISPITVDSGATLSMNYSGITTWSNNVSGAGLWQVATGTGSQTTSLAGNYSSFTGMLEVTNGGGKIVFSTPANFPSATATLQLDANETAYINVSGTFSSAIQMYGGTTGEGLGQLRLYNAVTASGPITLLADTTIGVDGGRGATISGNIGGGFGFTKLSAGTLTLSGENTYTGNTTVSAGTLNVRGTLGSGASTVTVAGVLAGYGTILSPVNVLSGGALAPGAVTSYSSLTISNNLTLAGQTIMELNNAGAVLKNGSVVASGNIAFGGTLVLSNLAGAFYMGDSFTLFQAASYSGSFAHISPTTPGSGLVWDTSQLAVNGVIMVMASGATTDTYSYAGYTITARSQFYAYNSLVNRPYPLYNYSVNIDQIGNQYMAVTGGDYTGSGEDGDHEFGWTSPAGRASTWSDIEGGGTSSSSSVPLFLQSNTFGANTMDPELIYNPANSTWYMYVQKQRSGGDQIVALTSTDRKNWTAHTSRSVVINIPSNVVFQHEEVIYVPWSSTPFWLYAYLEVNGVQKGYKLFESNDPLTFDYNAQHDSGGERNTGGQRGYLQEAASGPLFVRITEEGVGPGGANVPIIQFSNDGTSWTYSGWVVLAGSTNTGNYGNCFFPGISTINGNGALQYLGHNRWRAIYAATTALSDTAPNILNSEIGCGVVIIDLN